MNKSKRIISGLIAISIMLSICPKTFGMSATKPAAISSEPTSGSTSKISGSSFLSGTFKNIRSSNLLALIATQSIAATVAITQNLLHSANLKNLGQSLSDQNTSPLNPLLKKLPFYVGACGEIASGVLFGQTFSIFGNLWRFFLNPYFGGSCLPPLLKIAIGEKTSKKADKWLYNKIHRPIKNYALDLVIKDKNQQLFNICYKIENLLKPNDNTKIQEITNGDQKIAMLKELIDQFNMVYGEIKEEAIAKKLEQGEIKNDKLLAASTIEAIDKKLKQLDQQLRENLSSENINRLICDTFTSIKLLITELDQKVKDTIKKHKLIFVNSKKELAILSTKTIRTLQILKEKKDIDSFLFENIFKMPELLVNCPENIDVSTINNNQFEQYLSNNTDNIAVVIANNLLKELYQEINILLQNLFEEKNFSNDFGVELNALIEKLSEALVAPGPQAENNNQINGSINEYNNNSIDEQLAIITKFKNRIIKEIEAKERNSALTKNQIEQSIDFDANIDKDKNIVESLLKKLKSMKNKEALPEKTYEKIMKTLTEIILQENSYSKFLNSIEDFDQILTNIEKKAKIKTEAIATKDQPIQVGQCVKDGITSTAMNFIFEKIISTAANTTFYLASRPIVQKLIAVSAPILLAATLFIKK